jgi:PAS domain S-box-containing protein
MDFPKACYDSPKLLDTVLSCIQHAVIVADFEGQILFANPVVEDIFGFRPDELKANDLSIIFTPEDLTYLYPNLLYMARKNRPFEGELMLMDKHKKRFFAFMVFRPCFDPDLV